MNTNWKTGLSALAVCLLLWGCQTLTATFDQTALDLATALKADAIALTSEATEPYASHETDVATLNNQVDQAYEYAKSRPKNDLTVKQYELLRDPDKNLLGGFLKRWQTEGQLSEAFVTEATNLIAEACDKIIGLEESLKR